MIHVPWLPSSWGKRCAGLFDLVSIFPTVAALAGLPPPAGVDGEDLSALVSNPDSAVGPAAAYHQYPACGCSHPAIVCFNTTRQACNGSPKNTFNFMGYSVRTADWRYTVRVAAPPCKPATGVERWHVPPLAAFASKSVLRPALPLPTLHC